MDFGGAAYHLSPLALGRAPILFGALFGGSLPPRASSTRYGGRERLEQRSERDESALKPNAITPPARGEGTPKHRSRSAEPNASRP